MGGQLYAAVQFPREIAPTRNYLCPVQFPRQIAPTRNYLCPEPLGTERQKENLKFCSGN
jgi:hypothetical protein